MHRAESRYCSKQLYKHLVYGNLYHNNPNNSILPIVIGIGINIIGICYYTYCIVEEAITVASSKLS